jgi:hypothetical protein
VQERLDDDAWLAELVRITAAALPEPAPKKPRARRTTAKRRTPSPRDR